MPSGDGSGKSYGPTKIAASALDLVGNTPLVALDRIWPGPGRILGKCEFMNPCGSVKDRSSLGMIQRAMTSGEVKPGQPILVATSGNQGSGLAMAAAVLGNPLTACMSKGNSPQRATMMRALGAKVELVEQVEGKPGSVTAADVEAAQKHAQKLVASTGGFYLDQFNHVNNIHSHEVTTGPEIWAQTGGHVDAFLATVGTAGTFMGVSRFLKSKNPNVMCCVVEPKGAEVIAGCTVVKPLHLLQGSGYGRIPGLFKFDILDHTLAVTDRDIVEYKNLLGTKEGLYVGYTSAANVAAAVKLLKSGKVSADAWVVTMLNDTGLKYSELENYEFEDIE